MTTPARFPEEAQIYRAVTHNRTILSCGLVSLGVPLHLLQPAVLRLRLATTDLQPGEVAIRLQAPMPPTPKGNTTSPLAASVST